MVPQSEVLLPAWSGERARGQTAGAFISEDRSRSGRLTLVEQALELESGHEVLGGQHSGWWGRELSVEREGDGAGWSSAFQKDASPKSQAPRPWSLAATAGLDLEPNGMELPRDEPMPLARAREQTPLSDPPWAHMR